MADDRSDRAAQERSRINIHEDYKVTYWTEKWSVSAAQLRDAVAKVGVSVKAVDKELGKSSSGSARRGPTHAAQETTA